MSKGIKMTNHEQLENIRLALTGLYDQLDNATGKAADALNEQIEKLEEDEHILCLAITRAA